MNDVATLPLINEINSANVEVLNPRPADSNLTLSAKTATLKGVFDCLDNSRWGTVALVDADGKVTHSITEEDLLRSVSDGAEWTSAAVEYAEAAPPLVRPGDTRGRCLELIEGRRSIIQVDEDGKPIGLILDRNVLQYFRRLVFNEIGCEADFDLEMLYVLTDTFGADEPSAVEAYDSGETGDCWFHNQSGLSVDASPTMHFVDTGKPITLNRLVNRDTGGLFVSLETTVADAIARVLRGERFVLCVEETTLNGKTGQLWSTDDEAQPAWKRPHKVHKRKLLRLVSQWDILSAKARGKLRLSDGLSELGSDQVVTTTPDATVADAYAKMNDRRFSCLPVIDERENVVGAISMTDLVRKIRTVVDAANPTGESISDALITIREAERQVNTIPSSRYGA